MEFVTVMLVVKALWVGVAVAAPVGPVGVYCVDKTMTLGLRAGLFAGLGAALADMVWATLATVLVGALLDQETVLEWQSEIFLSAVPVLFVLALFVLRKARRSTMTAEVAVLSSQMRIKVVDLRLSRTIGGSFLLTMSNPLTILGFAGWVTWLGFGSGGGITLIEGMIITGGVFVGAMLWWGTLATVLHTFRSRAVKLVPFIDYTCVVLTTGAMVYSAYEGWPAAQRLSTKAVSLGLGWLNS